MAFIGLAVGTAFGFTAAVLAYLVWGVPLVLCLFIYAVTGAVFAMATIFGLYSRCEHDEEITGFEAEFDAASHGTHRHKTKLRADLA